MPTHGWARNLIWLMPAAYLAHIVEEYVGGFPAWVTHDVQGRFDDAAFAANNFAFMAILATLIYVNFRKRTFATTFPAAVRRDEGMEPRFVGDDDRAGRRG